MARRGKAGGAGRGAFDAASTCSLIAHALPYQAAFSALSHLCHHTSTIATAVRVSALTDQTPGCNHYAASPF